MICVFSLDSHSFSLYQVASGFLVGLFFAIRVLDQIDHKVNLVYTTSQYTLKILIRHHIKYNTQLDSIQKVYVFPA